MQVFTLDWNSEGKRLASGAVDQTVRINRVDAYCAVGGSSNGGDITVGSTCLAGGSCMHADAALLRHRMRASTQQ